MRKTSWLFLMPLIASMLWLGGAPSQAAGESQKIVGLTSFGCNENDIAFTFTRAGFDGGAYITRIRATVGSSTYMDQELNSTVTTGGTFVLFDNVSYAAPANKGAWPLPPNTQVEVLVTLERPKGTVLDASKMVLSACNSGTVRYVGAPSDDVDNDLVPVVQDACPALAAFTQNGCPVRDRSLGLAAKKSPRRVAGRLLASGFPALYVGRAVQIWKVRTGPDKLLKTLTTNSLGKFKSRVGKGRYYATSAGLVVASAGEAGADVSPVVRVR